MTEQLRFGLKLAIALLVLYLVSQAGTALVPIVISFIAAFILHPVARFFAGLPGKNSARQWGMPLAILLAFLMAALLGSFVVMVLISPLINEFSRLYKNIPQILTGIQAVIVELEKNVLLPLAKSGLYQQQSDQLIALLQQAVTGGISFSFNLLKNIANISVNVISRLIELIVVPVLTFYFIKDWRLIAAAFLTLFAPRYRREAEMILLEMGRVISDFLRGQFLLCLMIGTLMFAGLYALGVEYPLVLALLAGIAEMIPIIGPILSAVPAIFLGFIVSPILGLKVAGFCFILQQLENHIIVPKIMGVSVHLHPASVIISILIAGQFFGILGMMAALPVIALLKVFMQHFWITEEKNE